LDAGNIGLNLHVLSGFQYAFSGPQRVPVKVFIAKLAASEPLKKVTRIF
jgi:hypothetical protein